MVTKKTSVAKKVRPKAVKAPKKVSTKVTKPVEPVVVVATPAEKAPEVPSIFKGRYIEVVGRRKTAVARVRFYADAINDPKSSVFQINTQNFKEFFKDEALCHIAQSPLVMGNINHYAISCQVAGGGVRGQAEAVRLGISRALVLVHEGLRKELKDAGFLTRDPRMKERRKFGLKKARRAAQWSKR